MAEYNNGIYGFHFRYPPGWTLEEVPAGLNPATDSMPASGPAIRLTKGGVVMYIGYRRLTESYFLGGTGMPAGEFEDRGQVAFLGDRLDKRALVFEGKDKTLVYKTYQGASMVFLIRVDVLSQVDYSQVEVPQDVQQEVDRILSTFELSAP